MNKKNSVVERLRKRIPLETKLKVALQAQDLDNWHNGIYSGNAEMYLHTILKTIEKHEREHGVDASASILTLHGVSKAFCKCKEPKYNYPEMRWCDTCGLEINQNAALPKNNIKTDGHEDDCECSECKLLDKIFGQ